jgi:GTP cyclohydrolase I
MAKAFIGIGSNIDPAKNVEKAIGLLAVAVKVRGISTVYLTEPAGGAVQPPYYNCVVEIETGLAPMELKEQVLRRIETELGRVRSADRYAARPIDLDLVLYDELVMTDGGLILPAPDIVVRPFLAIPLWELAPDLKLPGSDKRISEIASALPGGGMMALHDYTEGLRKGQRMSEKSERIQELIRQLLTELGEDPDREGLAATPRRVAESLAYLTSGYHADVQALINKAIFEQETTSMVVVKDIEVYSMCEHHMLPFYGRCHIGYIPRGKVFGISKLARLVDVYARRLQIQERLTEQIAYAIKDSISADGVGVMIEARHLCMMMRGVEKQNSLFVTSSVLGVFRNNPATRDEFMSIINRPRTV